MSESKNLMTHVEFMVLLVSLLWVFYLLYGKIERQEERINKLYQIFIELVKEGKNER